MHGLASRTLVALVAIAALQPLTGCRPKPTSVHLDKDVDGKWETHHRVNPNDTINWRAPVTNTPDRGEFYIQFDGGSNPCGPDNFSGVSTPNVYNSKSATDSAGKGYWQAQCKLSNATNVKPPWSYGVYSGSNPPGVGRPVTPCNGCVMSQDSYSDQ
jgi:hypothetical protein